MKNIQFYKTVCQSMLLILGSLLICSGCSKDEDNKNGNDPEISIVGKWICTKNEGYEIKDDEKESWSDDEVGDYIIFEDDNTLYVSTEGGQYGTYVYSPSKGILTTVLDESLVSKVIKLTSTQLVVERSQEESNSEFYIKATYERVK